MVIGMIAVRWMRTSRFASMRAAAR
jgi:hypothetical protein